MSHRPLPAATLSDEALLSGMAVGDADSATAFIRRHQRRVFGVALAVTGDSAVAEEVAQATFEKAWRHGGMFDARRGSVQAWLSTIARNLAIDHLRSRRAPTIEFDLDQLAVADGRGPEDQAVVSAQARQLASALKELPANQARAVALAAYWGLTTAEIAQMEGVPQGTVKTRIHAGVHRLRVQLSEREVER